MSKRAGIFALLLLLTACGFSPLYAKKDNGTGAVSEFQQIKVANIPDRSGQILRNDLLDRLYTDGEPAKPIYTLNIAKVEEHVTSVDILPTSDATRAEMRLITVMTLTENATGKTLLRRDLLAAVSYNTLASEFTTLVSEDAVRTNGINELAQQAETQLALYFARKKS